jgi:hypothetical protein
LVAQRESELMREHTHLPAVMGFVSKHVAEHFHANRSGPSPAIPVELLHSAATAERVRKHLGAAGSALG